MMAKSSESFLARTRLYSAGTTRRFVRSPPAPKIVRIAGGARWPDRLFAAVAGGASNVVVTAGTPGLDDISEVVLRRPGRACLLGPCRLFSLPSAASAGTMIRHGSPRRSCPPTLSYFNHNRVMHAVGVSMRFTSTYTIPVEKLDTELLAFDRSALC